jgi:hypothetical protein
MLAVSGSGPNDVYFATASGNIWRFDGLTFGALPVYHNAVSSADLRSIWVSSTGAVFAGGDNGYLPFCKSGCSQPSNYFQATVAATITGVCGLDDTHVYAVGNNASSLGVMFRWNGTTWNTSAIPTTSYSNAGCWVAANGDVFIAAQSKILHFDGVAITSETIVWPAGWGTSEIALQNFEAVWGSGSTLFATGSRLRVISRDGAGTWTFAFNQNGVNDNHTLYGSGPNDAFAAGARSSTANLTRFDATKTPPWAYVQTADVPDITFWGLWAASPKLYYVAGTDSGGLTGVIYRATR